MPELACVAQLDRMGRSRFKIFDYRLSGSPLLEMLRRVSNEVLSGSAAGDALAIIRTVLQSASGERSEMSCR